MSDERLTNAIEPTKLALPAGPRIDRIVARYVVSLGSSSDAFSAWDVVEPEEAEAIWVVVVVDDENFDPGSHVEWIEAVLDSVNREIAKVDPTQVIHVDFVTSAEMAAANPGGPGDDA